MVLVSVWESNPKSKASSIDNDHIAKFSFHNMSGADPPRWRQNHSESRLPHIITPIEDKHEVSLILVVLFITFSFSTVINIRSRRPQDSNSSVKSKG